MASGNFGGLALSAPVMRSLDDMGFEEPTPVQVQAIPPLLKGRDLVAQALTGTGKTAAFGIPLVERVDVKRNVPQAVVLAPTRELAVQVAEQLGQLGRHRGVRLVPIYGGQPIDRQLRALRHGVQVIVATPGRLMDHMRRGTVDLTEVTMLVLDEADQRHRCAQSPLPHSERTSHSASLQQDVRTIPTADAGRRMPRESH